MSEPTVKISVQLAIHYYWNGIGTANEAEKLKHAIEAEGFVLYHNKWLSPEEQFGLEDCRWCGKLFHSKEDHGAYCFDHAKSSAFQDTCHEPRVSL